MKTILLLTNFTKTSSKAIEQFMRVFAPKLADSCTFILLNAWKQPRTGQSQLHSLNDYLQEISGFELMKEQAKLVKLLPGVKPVIKVESAHGDIVGVLNLLYESSKPDLIVMGSKGSGVMRDLLAGSTTGRIVRQLRSPVLIIPENVEFKYPQRIVLASEMKECSNEEDFERLTEIVRLFMSEFVVLNIYKEEKPETEKFETCMKKYLEGINYDFQYKQHHHIAESITEFSVNMNAGLLAMICHNENLLIKLFKHSVSTKLTQRAELPLLIIHE